MSGCTFSRNILGSKVGIYIGLYAITNNFCVVRARNDFYLPVTLRYDRRTYIGWSLKAYEYPCSHIKQKSVLNRACWAEPYNHDCIYTRMLGRTLIFISTCYLMSWLEVATCLYCWATLSHNAPISCLPTNRTWGKDGGMVGDMGRKYGPRGCGKYHVY